MQSSPQDSYLKVQHTDMFGSTLLWMQTSQGLGASSFGHRAWDFCQVKGAPHKVTNVAVSTLSARDNAYTTYIQQQIYNLSSFDRGQKRYEERRNSGMTRNNGLQSDSSLSALESPSHHSKLWKVDTRYRRCCNKHHHPMVYLTWQRACPLS